eukprot:749705-Hanusia_phi.AAC.1
MLEQVPLPLSLCSPDLSLPDLQAHQRRPKPRLPLCPRRCPRPRPAQAAAPRDLLPRPLADAASGR